MVISLTMLNLFNIMNPYCPKDFSIVFDTVPLGIISLFKAFKGNGSHPLLLDSTETTVGKDCFSQWTKNKNKAVCQLFQQDIISTTSLPYHMCPPLLEIFVEKERKFVFWLFVSFFTHNKVKAVSLQVFCRNWRKTLV